MMLFKDLSAEAKFEKMEKELRDQLNRSRIGLGIYEELLQGTTDSVLHAGFYGSMVVLRAEIKWLEGVLGEKPAEQPGGGVRMDEQEKVKINSDVQCPDCVHVDGLRRYKSRDTCKVRFPPGTDLSDLFFTKDGETWKSFKQMLEEEWQEGYDAEVEDTRE